MSRHIPGNPTIVVQNMPGAGSIKAANFLYTIAPKGRQQPIGGFSRGAFLDPLLGRGEGTQYDAVKFNWLGSISNESASAPSAQPPASSPAGHAHETVHHRGDRRGCRQRRLSDRAAQDVPAAHEDRRRLRQRGRSRDCNQAQRGSTAAAAGRGRAW